MSALGRLVPHPVTSVLLLASWLLLQGSASPGHLLLGAGLALGLPAFTRRFWPEWVPLSRPRALLAFVALVLWDIVLANFSVAVLVLGPARSLRPGFVRIPLDMENDFAITTLANTVSITPGTVSAELSADRRHLIVHYLACDDEAALVETVKQRYEAPIKEIFGC